MATGPKQDTSTTGTGTQSGNTSSNLTGTTGVTNAGSSTSTGTSSLANASQSAATGAGTSVGSSVSNPWAPAAPLLQGMLTQAAPLISAPTNTALTSGLTGLEGAATNAAGFDPKISDVATGMLNGGGYGTGAGNITGGYKSAVDALTPYANGSSLDPTKDPMLQGELQNIQYDTNNQVGDRFSGAGRGGPMSGMTDPNGAFAGARAEGVCLRRHACPS